MTKNVCHFAQSCFNKDHNYNILLQNFPLFIQVKQILNDQINILMNVLKHLILKILFQDLLKYHLIYSNLSKNKSSKNKHETEVADGCSGKNSSKSF